MGVARCNKAIISIFSLAIIGSVDFRFERLNKQAESKHQKSFECFNYLQKLKCLHTAVYIVLT